MLTSIFFGFLLFSILTRASVSDTLHLTAIVGKDGVSQMECWSLLPRYAVSSQSGTVGSKQLQLGLLANGSYTMFPLPGPYNAGLHNAPNFQYVILLAGNATVTFPERPTESLSIKTGDMLIAADVLGTSALGHETVWQGGSVAVQVPFEPGFIPDHHTSPGSCR
ncbi:small secreted protein [Laccaria bicolor S238N-H82]|uniref:Small secreted protein n=1 Tax=Laccaria bicolor (strain S238N-H82 / ATCC MYA-4686) TaxID=486041 RepID=B0DF98_LACBS|nr:small secreted protein [Laccaria bicolor S238N-H82]EDR06672.1 small secreted protein [Laccaria bicolor S238N-H82]|eukprot:XP_001882519.1 small secreted protein [Laccaria bicolor S238N-H82]